MRLIDVLNPEVFGDEEANCPKLELLNTLETLAELETESESSIKLPEFTEFNVFRFDSVETFKKLSLTSFVNKDSVLNVFFNGFCLVSLLLSTLASSFTSFLSFGDSIESSNLISVLICVYISCILLLKRFKYFVCIL